MRCVGLDLHQLVNAALANSTALRASDELAEDTSQHWVSDAGPVTVKVDELVSSFPSSHWGIMRFAPCVIDGEAMTLKYSAREGKI
jgi:hypothetical protein